MRAQAGLAAVYLLVMPLTAAAQQQPLRVERGQGAQSCPDAAELASTVTTIREGKPITTGDAYEVIFTKHGAEYRAEIKPSHGESERVLDSRASDCNDLTKAVAVTLALLFDSRTPPLAAEERPAPTPSRAAPPTATSRHAGAAAKLARASSSRGAEQTAADSLSAELPLDLSNGARTVPSSARSVDAGSLSAAELPPSLSAGALTAPSSARSMDAGRSRPSSGVDPNGSPPSAAARSLWIRLSAGAGLDLGVLRFAAPAFVADVGVTTADWRAEIGALYTPTQTLALAPGAIAVQLWAAVARVCYSAWREPLRIDACVGARLGQASAQASGFTRDGDRQRRLYLAVPVALTAARYFGRIGLELSAALLLPLAHDAFTVEGAGPGYDPPPLGAALTLSLVALM